MPENSSDANLSSLTSVYLDAAQTIDDEYCLPNDPLESISG